MRHSTYPKLYSRNYPAISFEYFKLLDSSRGSFLAKVQFDLNGSKSNMGQSFIQLSQTLRFWRPKVELAMTYTGGVGTTPDSFGFYINNSLGIGAAYPFQWRGAFFSSILIFRYNAFERPSYDPQLTFYAGKGYFGYKLFVSVSFTFWTQNNDMGIDATKELSGKGFKFFGDPQIWVKVIGAFSLGSRVYIYHNILNRETQFFPTLGAKYQF